MRAVPGDGGYRVKAIEKPSDDLLADARRYLLAMGVAYQQANTEMFVCGCRIGIVSAAICDRHSRALVPTPKKKRKGA